MRKYKKNGTIYIVGILLLGITLGYAYLNTTLNINGTTNITSANWSIYWDNIVLGSNNVTDITTPATISSGLTEVTFNVNFSQPGDTYEFTVDAVNDGSIDAMISTFSKGVYASNGTTPKNLPDYLEYTVTYGDGVEIANKQLLESGKTETYKVRVHYKEDITASQLPSTNDNYVFKFSVDYVQADDTAEEVVHGLTGTRYTTNKYINGNDNEYVWIGQKPTENITLYNTVTEAKAAFSNIPFYLKHELENDIVKDSYVCFEKDSNTYCLRGQATYEKVNNNWQCKSEFYDSENNKCLSTYYESNKTILKNAFGESNCTQYSSYLNCREGGLSAYAHEHGDVNVAGDSAYCRVYSYGDSHCTEL